MSSLFKNWNIFRLLRLILGVMVLVQGIISTELVWIIFGSMLTLLPLLNAGCCSASSCNIPSQPNKNQPEEITYEEVR